MSNHVHPIRPTVQGTFIGKRFLTLTSGQILFEETWARFLSETLGPEMVPEEMEALDGP